MRLRGTVPYFQIKPRFRMVLLDLLVLTYCFWVCWQAMSFCCLRGLISKVLSSIKGHFVEVIYWQLCNLLLFLGLFGRNKLPEGMLEVQAVMDWKKTPVMVLSGSETKVLPAATRLGLRTGEWVPGVFKKKKCSKKWFQNDFIGVFMFLFSWLLGTSVFFSCFGVGRALHVETRDCQGKLQPVDFCITSSSVRLC